MNWQIGYVTQAGILFLIVGLYLLIKPYNIAKWHANDAEIERRLHKREQSHKKKSERQPYRRDPNRVDVEPSLFSVNVFRIMGGAATVIGIVMIVWSFI